MHTLWICKDIYSSVLLAFPSQRKKYGVRFPYLLRVVYALCVRERIQFFREEEWNMGYVKWDTGTTKTMQCNHTYNHTRMNTIWFKHVHSKGFSLSFFLVFNVFSFSFCCPPPLSSPTLYALFPLSSVPVACVMVWHTKLVPDHKTLFSLRSSFSSLAFSPPICLTPPCYYLICSRGLVARL